MAVFQGAYNAVTIPTAISSRNAYHVLPQSLWKSRVKLQNKPIRKKLQIKYENKAQRSGRGKLSDRLGKIAENFKGKYIK